MKNLVYLAYGGGSYVQEVAFSLLSARRFIDQQRPDYRFLIYTDCPHEFQDLSATIESLAPQQLEEWAGPHGFRHRRKILALADVLQKYPAPTVLLDGDTYFTASPDELFTRIGPGRSLMHIAEGSVSGVSGWGYRELSALLANSNFRDPAGNLWDINPDSIMWNSGVVGIDPRDEVVLQEVLRLTDSIFAHLAIHTAEQFAFSYVLSQRTRIGEAADIVFHYWLPYLRDPFRQELPRLMSMHGDLPEDERARRLFPHRPRPTWLRRRKLVVKRALQQMGYCRTRGVRCNG
jgi:hypothetical protein